MMKEISDYRKRIDENNQENETLKSKINKLTAENKNLNQEFENAQESLRLSANQQSKLAKEVNEYKIQIAANNQESETYRQKIQKLQSENVGLNSEVREAQDNLRLSANQMAKLKNEFKIVCNENEELKRMLSEAAGGNKRTGELEEKVILLSAEVQRLRSSGVNEAELEGSKKKLVEYENK